MTADYNSNRLTLLVGNKTAAFTTGVQVGVVAGAGTIVLPNYVVAGDFNKDGKPDVAVPRIGTMSNVVLLLGTGMQATPFGTPAAHTAGGNPYAAVTGDWNGDGNLDLAVNNTMSNSVTLLLGSASGAMTVSGTPLGTGMRPEHMATADVNSDGLPDFVTANTTSGDLSVLLGQDRTPSYVSAQTISPGAGITPKWVAAADVNADGKDDLLVVDYKTAAAGGVVVLLNTSQ